MRDAEVIKKLKCKRKSINVIKTQKSIPLRVAFKSKSISRFEQKKTKNWRQGGGKIMKKGHKKILRRCELKVSSGVAKGRKKSARYRRQSNTHTRNIKFI